MIQEAAGGDIFWLHNYVLLTIAFSNLLCKFVTQAILEWKPRVGHVAMHTM